MYKVLHFWSVSGGMGHRFELLLDELKQRGDGELLGTPKAVLASLYHHRKWWKKDGSTVFFFTSLLCPLIALIQLIFPKVHFIYLVRGDEILEANFQKRAVRKYVAYLFQLVLWRIMRVKHSFVSWDLEELFKSRYGKAPQTSVVPNTLGVKLPPTRRFNGCVTLVGDFSTVKDIEWTLRELEKTEFSIKLYGNTELPDHWKTDKISAFGVVSNLRKIFRDSSLLVLASQSEGYPNIVNEALSEGCAVVLHDEFPFKRFPLSQEWKFKKQHGNLVSLLRKAITSDHWSYDEDNFKLRSIVERNWFELVLEEKR